MKLEILLVVFETLYIGLKFQSKLLIVFSAACSVNTFIDMGRINQTRMYLFYQK